MTEAIKAWVKRNQNHFKDSNEKNHLIEFLVNKYGHKNSINFSYPQCVIKAEEWVKELNLSNENSLNPGKTKLVMDFGGLKIVRLLNQDSRNWEGSLMKHCVAIYTDQDELYSLRDSKDLPHCTIEVKKKIVSQIRGKANGGVKPEYITPVLKFLESKKLKISAEEMNNLGYQKLKTISFFKNNFTNPKLIQLNNDYYIYTKNKLILKRKFKNSEIEGLRYFCKTGQSLEAVKQFVENGIYLKAVMLPLLLIAIENKNLELVKYFVGEGADLKSWGDKILTEVCLRGDLETAKFLLSKGLNVCANQYKFIWDCFYFKKIKLLRFLIKNAGKEILKISNNRLIPVYQSGDLESVKLLVEKGLNQKGKDSAIYLVAACHAEEEVVIKTVSYLLEVGAWNERSVINAIHCKYFKVANLLIESGNPLPQYVMTAAIQSKNIEMVKILLANGIKIDVGDLDLYILKTKEYKEMADFIKSKGIDFNPRLMSDGLAFGWSKNSY